MTEDIKISDFVNVLRDPEGGFRLHPDEVNKILGSKEAKSLDIKFLFTRAPEKLTPAEQTILDLFDEDKIKIIDKNDLTLDFFETISAMETHREDVRRQENPGMVVEAFKKIIHYLNIIGGTNLKIIFEPVYKMLLEKDIIPKEFTDKFELTAKDDTLPPILFKIVLMLLAAPTFLTAFTTSFLKLSEQKNNQKFRPDLPGLAEIIGNYYKNPETRSQIKEIMEKQGLKEDHIKLIQDGLHEVLRIPEIQDLFYREVFDKNEAVKRLKTLGYEGKDPERIMELFKIIPNIQDIIRMAVRDVWNPSVVSDFGLDEDFPEEFGFWSEKQGVSREWAEKYWQSHWVLPSPNLAFEMFHREQLTKPELFNLLKAADFPRKLRPKMVAVAYNPLTRVDIRRMHKVGVLSEAEVKRRYMHVGFSPEDAQLMTEFTVQYNKSDKLNISKSNILSGFREGILEKEDASNLLQSTGLSEGEANYLITLEEYKEENKLNKIMLSNVEENFKLNLISNAEARNKLSEIGIKAKKQTALLEQWQIERFKKTKRPDSTTLVKWLKAGIINLKRYERELSDQGWSNEYIKFIVEELKL